MCVDRADLLPISQHSCLYFRPSSFSFFLTCTFQRNFASYGSNARYVSTNYTCISRNNIFCAPNVTVQHDSTHVTTITHYFLHCTNAIHNTVRTLRGILAQNFVRDVCISANYSSLFTHNYYAIYPHVRIKHITNEYTEGISTLLTHSMNTVHHYCAHCTPKYSTVHNVPISIRILRPLHHSILHCAQYTISIQVLRTLQPSILHCAQCTHQYPNTVPTVALNTAVCAQYPSVGK